MKPAYFRASAALMIVTLVSACGGDRGLMNLTRQQQGPDEFAVIPGKPIEQPADYSTLPPPTPGGVNRTDATPNADAVAALGGNPNRLALTGRTSDGDLVRAAGRYGTDPNIRAQLTAADEEFRRRNKGRLLERWFRVTTYFDAYSGESLDQHETLDQYRARGARTPGVPPEGLEE